MELLKYLKSKFSRRKFLITGTVVFSSVSVLKVLSLRREKKTKTAMFLSKDGELFEVQVENLPRTKVLATTNQVKNWVWGKISR